MRGKILLPLMAVCVMSQTKPPESRREAVADLYHGVPVVDPYRWLEDDGGPATRSWIRSQQAHTAQVLKSLPGRQTLKARLTELMRVEEVGLPLARAGRYFFVKRKAGENRRSIYFRHGREGREEVLIDPGSVSPSENISINLAAVSRDGRVLAYQVQQGGQDETEVRFREVGAVQDRPVSLPKAHYLKVELRPDGSAVYYARLDHEGTKVFYRALAPQAREEPIFGAGLPADHIAIPSLGEDGRWLVINVSIGAAGDRSKLYLLDLARGMAVIPVATQGDAAYHGVMGGGHLFIRTTHGAPKGRLLRVDPERRQRHFWRLVIPEGKHQLESVEPAGGHLIATHLVDAAHRLTIYPPSGGAAREIGLPGAGTASVSGQWSSDEFFLSYASFNSPDTIWRAEVRDEQRTLWHRRPVPVDGARIEVEQVWFRSKDGTRVPMFLVSNRAVPMDGERPVLLAGYGGFSINLTPFFSEEFAAWIERGGVAAVVNLRGGAEFGEAWHEAGMRGNKQTVFDDFIAAAEWLIRNKVTKPRRLAISGASNGGLLVGAALTQRPDLFRAVLCAVPLLDMLRYQNFLVGRLWVPEYGSSEDREQFEYLRRYSPYHNVKERTPYPAIMFMTGDSDTRVAPLHARKMCARLQAATTSGLPVLLHYDTESGHAGGKPVGKQIDDATDELMFLLWQCGVLDSAK